MGAENAGILRVKAVYRQLGWSLLLYINVPQLLCVLLQSSTVK